MLAPISSTHPAAARTITSAGRTWPTSWSTSGIVNADQFALVFGYAPANRCAIVSTSRLAASGVAPGASRPYAYSE